MPDSLDAAEFLATTLYAVLLDEHKEKIEPDWTWAEVVLGTSVCLLTAAVRARAHANPTWRIYEEGVWRAFVVGGLPIIVWRIYRKLTADAELKVYRAKKGK